MDAFRFVLGFLCVSIARWIFCCLLVRAVTGCLGRHGVQLFVSNHKRSGTPDFKLYFFSGTPTPGFLCVQF